MRISIWFGKTETKTKSFTPHFHTHEHRFRDDPAFQDSTSRGDNAWLSMFPSGDGSIAVKNPRQYGLPPSSVAVDGQGNKVADTEIYDVSVVRQLGCLALLRDFIVDHDATISQGSYIHRDALHCLDHVRQALLCAADTTLEPTGDDTVLVDTEPDPVVHRTHYVDVGFASARHTCRNYTEIQEWMEANKVKL